MLNWDYSLTLIVHKFAFPSFWNPTCVQRIMPACSCTMAARAGKFLLAHAECFFGLIFPKIDLFTH